MHHGRSAPAENRRSRRKRGVVSCEGRAALRTKRPRLGKKAGGPHEQGHGVLRTDQLISFTEPGGRAKEAVIARIGLSCQPAGTLWPQPYSPATLAFNARKIVSGDSDPAAAAACRSPSAVTPLVCITAPPPRARRAGPGHTSARNSASAGCSAEAFSRQNLAVSSLRRTRLARPQRGLPRSRGTAALFLMLDAAQREVAAATAAHDARSCRTCCPPLRGPACVLQIFCGLPVL